MNKKAWRGVGEALAPFLNERIELIVSNPNYLYRY